MSSAGNPLNCATVSAVKNGSTRCFAMSGDLTATESGTLTMTMKNAAGTVVGTFSEEVTSEARTITCAGGQPVALNIAGIASCT